jgi:preprotein translocase subunit SecA
MEKNVELSEEGIAAAELALDTDDLWSEKDPWAKYCSYYYC